MRFIRSVLLGSVASFGDMKFWGLRSALVTKGPRTVYKGTYLYHGVDWSVIVLNILLVWAGRACSVLPSVCSD